MNKNLKLITSTISLCVAIIAVAVVAVAWLSLNNETKSTGMKMDVDVSPNLVISKSSTDIVTFTGANVKTSTVDNTVITYTEDAAKYVAVTHDKNFGTYMLKYNTNPSEVSSTTGEKKGTTDLTFAEVTGATVNSKNYFIDYTFYIASVEAALTMTTGLTATVAATTTIDTTSAFNALSIDFWIDGTYKSTINLGKTQTSSALVTDSIPYNQATSGNKYITVVMRCYFDGALESASGQAYINSAAVSTIAAALEFNVTFNAN